MSKPHARGTYYATHGVIVIAFESAPWAREASEVRPANAPSLLCILKPGAAEDGPETGGSLISGRFSAQAENVDSLGRM